MGFLCTFCDEALTWGVPVSVALDHGGMDGLAASYYHGVIARALAHFKDHERGQALPFLLHALGKIADKLDFDGAVIVPIPTTAQRLAIRGFYPVGVLARYLSALTGAVLYDGLTRQKEGSHQRGLSRTERLGNVHEAFLADHPPPSDKVIIFDDVITTGATIKAAANALLAACPHLSIKVCCVAHGKPT